ncbi:chemotaxis protein CheB [Lentzea tibetensis]|uniref:protein-glutamate methylesterase n=1 Tax=Lentzea tibetensis TaxID=2591470 RepID=A0A563ETK8_9PSEU|nr:chemotaxis protein CheB [Lentzea tibetensis]TWP50868.1 chemotaxis protein CheB [Lentzea tibetensis]
MAPARRDLVVVGASAGGVEALTKFVASLPANLPAAVAVVLHMPSRGPSALHFILSRSGPLRCVPVSDGQPVRPGRVYVAPPDRHLVVSGEQLRLSDEPPALGHRPSVDVLFSSAARTRGARTIGVVLSGALADGTAGMVAIKSRGGVALVQDPVEARCSGMPLSVIRHVRVDHVLPVGEIGHQLAHLVGQQVDADGPVRDELSMERALWTALHTLDEKAELSRRMRASPLARAHSYLAERYARAHQEAAEAADVLRAHLTRRGLEQ